MTQRLKSVDFLRGLVMLLMTLDHTRDIFSSIDIGNHIGTALPASYYFTRWITHLCAPTFVFLSGLSIVLRQQRHHSSLPELQFTILKRGIFLTILSLTVVSLLWTIILRDSVFTVYFAELSVIGLGMAFIALMLYLKPPIVLLISILLVAGHNLLDRWDYIPSHLWHLLHAPEVLLIFGGQVQLNLLYPILPWLGIAGLGYCAGYYCWQTTNKTVERKKLLLRIATTCLGLFVILRFTNFYGDPYPFVYTSGHIMQNLYSFLDVTKYPPSLLYTLITLSLSLFTLSFSDANYFQKPNRFVAVVTHYGDAALFFYVFHLIVIATMAYILAFLFNHGQLIRSSYLSFSYLMTFIVLALCYPVIGWFTRFKNKYELVIDSLIRLSMTNSI